MTLFVNILAALALAVLIWLAMRHGSEDPPRKDRP